MTDPDQLAARARRVPGGVLAWSRAGGFPGVRSVLPLVEPPAETAPGAGPGLVLALTYAESADAVSLGAAGRAVLVLDAPADSEDPRTWLVDCGVSVAADPEGAAFRRDLLTQELQRRPASRLLADSPLLRREHPWFLPRLLVRLEPSGVTSLDRSSGHDHLLVVQAADRLATAPVRPPGGSATTGSSARLSPTFDDGTVAPPAGPATLVGHALSPDRERSAAWSWCGAWDGSVLAVTESAGRVGLPPTPSLLARWRTHRAFERACRLGLREAGLPG